MQVFIIDIYFFAPVVNNLTYFLTCTLKGWLETAGIDQANFIRHTLIEMAGWCITK